MDKKKVVSLACALLLAGSFVVWSMVLRLEFSAPSKILKIAFLDIGQGDSIYIEAPNGNQVVVDGGPGPVELSALGAVMPWNDHSINALVVTNPDKDHFAGFIDVLNRYTIGEVFEPGTFNKSDTYKALEDAIKEKNVKEVLGYRGMTLLLDSKNNVSLQILFPDRDVSKETSNDGSIVMKLVYGKRVFMLMGDATAKVEHHLAADLKDDLHADVLKLGHHGSKTSSSEELLEAVHPAYAIVSAGLNNKYGHPHKEVTDRLTALHIPYLITFKEGTITFETDGDKLIRK
jgi:competence protein ComEC